MFSTHNGKQIGKAILLEKESDSFKPCVGLECCSIEANFGDNPFIYDRESKQTFRKLLDFLEIPFCDGKWRINAERVKFKKLPSQFIFRPIFYKNKTIYPKIL
ncbi:hypothetical protein Mgra_00006821 [Meloidogyne graminicola]|uniref:Uncharacterized protein n=1 Tax=Meloidogyne graminicola TaxID=189291 RepID=A0A8S9ZKF2_9BILA|nr:hypothetical protein Mgra_00006821 [Meloidogyne graminicola]